MGASSSGACTTSRSTIRPISARTERSRAMSFVQNSTRGRRLSSTVNGKPEGSAASAASRSYQAMSGPPPALGADVVHQEVLAEALGSGEEGTPSIDPRHLIDEGHEVLAAFQHERVDG